MKILLIDDEEDIRKIADLSLRAIGHMEVETASGVREGLQRAAAQRPEAILMDMMMPEMDGLEGLAALQADPALRDIPVIFMTAKVQRAEVEAYLNAGAAGVIQKPFDPMTLSAELKRLLDDLG